VANQEKEEIIKTLLSSLRFSQPGGRWQFLWNPQHPYLFSGGLGFEFFIDFEKQTISSIQAIKRYQTYLSGYSISSVSSLLQKYFESVISDIGADALFLTRDKNRSVLDVTPNSKFSVLIDKLDRFIEKNAIKLLYLMPVNGFPCPKSLVNMTLAWVPGSFDLADIFQPLGINPSFIKNERFPPINDQQIRYHSMTVSDSWFICHASSESEAESTFKRMVGALSVILEYPKSRFITGRQMIKGRAQFNHDGSFTLFDKPPLAPAVGTPIEITEDMIDRFYSLLIENSADSRIQVALEYLADAWGNTPRISFINNSIAMDALFGIPRQVRTSILSGVESYASEIPDSKDKYDLILNMRNGLLHGEYPTLELCPHYLEYFEKYKKDPIDEQILIINKCLLKLSESP